MTRWLYRAFLPLVFVHSFYSSFQRSEWQGHHWTISYDAEHYYHYLPLVFVYGTAVNMPVNSNQIQINGQPLIVFKPDSISGKIQSMTTYGVALFELPFFLSAHQYAKWKGYEQSGYSLPYLIAILLAASTAITIGFHFIRKYLERFFPLHVILLACMLMWWGTNLMQAVVAMPGYSHIYSFALGAAMLHFTARCYENPGWRQAIQLGVVCGWLLLIRPTNACMFFFVLLYEVFSFSQLKVRLKHLLIEKPNLLIACIAAGTLFYIPQLVYWKYISGSYIFYSYGDQGFSFWRSPYLLSALFDVRTGMLTYSPLLLLPFTGTFVSIIKKQLSGWGVLLSFTTAYYLFCSWWMWHFGGPYGYRPVIEFYPLLMAPLAWVLHRLLKSNPMIAFPSFILIVLLVVISYRWNFMYRYTYEYEWWGWDDYLRGITGAFK